MNRKDSIDSFRLIAAFAVVTLHVYLGAIPFESTVYIRLISRFAVPFFFLLTGYFFYLGYQKAGDNYFLKTISKLMNLFLIAWVIFLPKALLTKSFRIDGSLLLVGTDGHLWFLPSMIFGLVICWNSLKYRVRLVLPILAIVFFTPVILYTYFNDYSIHSLIDFKFSRFIVSVSFLSIGMMVARYKIILSLRKCYLLIILSLFALVAEVYGLKTNSTVSIWGIEFLISTSLFATGIFFLSFQTLNSKRLGELGRKYSLGIYLYHPLINTVTYHIILMLFGELSNMILVINPVICFTSTLTVLILLSKFFPRLYDVLNGDFEKKSKPVSVK